MTALTGNHPRTREGQYKRRLHRLGAKPLKVLRPANQNPVWGGSGILGSSANRHHLCLPGEKLPDYLGLGLQGHLRTPGDRPNPLMAALPSLRLLLVSWLQLLLGWTISLVILPNSFALSLPPQIRKAPSGIIKTMTEQVLSTHDFQQQWRNKGSQTSLEGSRGSYQLRHLDPDVAGFYWAVAGPSGLPFRGGLVASVFTGSGWEGQEISPGDLEVSPRVGLSILVLRRTRT